MAQNVTESTKLRSKYKKDFLFCIATQTGDIEITLKLEACDVFTFKCLPLSSPRT